MAETFHAGTAYATIKPRLDPNWKRSLKERIEDRRNDPNATVEVKPTLGSLTNFRRELDTTLSKINGKVDVTARLTGIGDLRSELRNSLKSVRGDVEVTPKLAGIGQFKTELRNRLRTGLPAAEVGVTLDFTRARQQLAAFRAATPDLHINLDLDTGGATAGMAGMIAQAAALRAALNGINLGGSGGGGLGGLGGGGGAAASAAGGMGSMLPMIGAIAALAPVALGAVGQLGIGMLGLGAAAGPALATIALGFEGIKTAAQSIQPQFDALKTQVSDVFAREMAPAFESIGSLMESLGPEMEGIASGISGLFTGVTDALTGPGWDSLQELFGSIPQFLSAMGPGLNDLVVGFTDLGLAAAPAMEAMGAGLGDVLGEFGQALTGLMESGDLTALFEGFGQALTGFGQLLGPLVTMLGQLGAELGGSLGGLFAQFGEIFTQLTPAFREIVGVVGPVLVDTFAALVPAIGPLGQAFASLVSAVAPVLPLIAQLVGNVVSALAPALTVLLDALAPVIESMVAQLQPVIQQLAPILAQVAMTIAEGLAAAFQAIAPSLPLLAESFGQIVLAIAPFLPQLAQIISELLPPLLGLFNDLVQTILPPVTEGLTWLAQNVLPLVITAVTDLARSWGEKIETVRRVFGEAKDFIGGAVDGIVGFFTGMGSSIAGVWDGVVANVKTAVRAIGDLLQRVPTKIGPIPVPGGQGARDLGAKLSEWAQNNADGGFITGPGTGTSDSILSWLSNGEFVVRAAVVKDWLPFLEALNSGKLPKFATGGHVGFDREGAISKAQAHDGEPYIYGGLDCSGYLSAVFNAGTGQNVRFVTGSDFEAMGWVPGFDPNGFSIGTDKGVGVNGHMAGTLFGVNIESDGSNGIQYGRTADGALDFPFVYHWPGASSGDNPSSEAVQGLDYGTGDAGNGLDYSGGNGPSSWAPIPPTSGGSTSGTSGTSSSGTSALTSQTTTGPVPVTVTNWPAVLGAADGIMQRIREHAPALTGMFDSGTTTGGASALPFPATGSAPTADPTPDMPWYMTADPVGTLAARAGNLAQSQAQGWGDYLKASWPEMLETAVGVAGVGGLQAGMTINGNVGMGPRELQAVQQRHDARVMRAAKRSVLGR
ncbi:MULTISPECIES: hypothetical protein [Rhodococcus]|uniref:phage tail protein n=1 Tax=Rhodococcus TaxID=1827 RepID=UPI00193C0F4C|nr:MULTISPECIES: hypothetical protein [Rhodococcus]QRI76262.1 hypothetical protein JQ505_00055 [Rhodococcus aetherivorans]QSE59673.1 hypothetical protein JYA75_01170 [Rhodococcus sp. PSBB066]